MRWLHNLKYFQRGDIALPEDEYEIPTVKSPSKYAGRGKNRKWTIKNAAWCGYLKARGETSTEIGKRLKVKPEVVRLKWQQWGLPKNNLSNGRVAIIPVPLHSSIRSSISHEASNRGMETDEFIAFLLKIISKDNLWESVIDDN